MPPRTDYHPSTAHASLGWEFYDAATPAQFPMHVLRYRNQLQAARIGLDTLTAEEWIAHFGRFEPLPGSLPQPLALRYHGHQFRHYNPELGDGRGFLFAQAHDLTDGRLLDLGTKGSGTTPYSRAGDGRLTLKGGVREVLATTMLEALGVNTSKSFSLIETGEELVRGDEPSPTRSAVLVRLNHSHIRVGSFQRLAYLKQPELILELMDHTIRTHMPSVWRDDTAGRAAAFLAEVAARVAETGGQWMAAGFVHGVLNTDNINVTGESFDYGPWRFLPTYQADFTAAYFDHGGLYAYGRQPETLLWNLARLAGCLLPLAEKSDLEAALAPFWDSIHDAYAKAMVRRLGLASRGMAEDRLLARSFSAFLGPSQLAYEQAIFDVHAGRCQGGCAEDAGFAECREMMQAYRPDPGCDLGHRYFARAAPCTMLIEDVEALWSPIAQADDWSVFDAKLAEIAEMAEATGTARPPAA